ncbi:MAG TPA: hypothetical protein VJ499_13230 [Flavisolibacter sp.]|nr:hypothetical protein [Flavisolibacter sp.]
MKNNLIYLLLAWTIFSCNESTPSVPESDKYEHVHHDAISTDSLNLNNGKKWQGDSVTKANVSSLQAVVQETIAISNPGQKEYNNAGISLKNQLDKLINECRMQGPDHEALHKWLTPLFNKVSALVKTQDSKEASELIEEIHMHLNTFNTYFE